LSIDRVLTHFREQAGFCEEYGSPFTAQLLERFAGDLESGGPVADLVGAWPTSPRADALALRLAGALHAAALTGRDKDLAALYPANNPHWRMDEVWPVARDFLKRDPEWAAQFLQFAPQTNETRRSIALLLGFLTFAKQWAGPIDMLEIGASAGLNLNWDKFTYRAKTWSWGQPGPVVIDTDWRGPAPPIETQPQIRARAACDVNPLDVRNADERLRLRSFIWADQPDRLARFDGAVTLAIGSGVQVERADAAEWLACKLPARARDAATLVYHSVFLQYPPREARAAIIAAIHKAGSSAGAEAPLAWVRLEPEALTDGVRESTRMVIDLTIWPRGERRILGYADGHVRVVEVT
jgi:hypothetical protein